MKTLIVYASIYGTTEKCAQELKEMLPGETDLFRLVKKKVPALEGYDRVIFGSPVYMGRLTKEGSRFLDEFEGALLEKEFSLFLVCSNVGKKTFEHNLDYNFSFELLEHAKAKGCFGGELDMSKLGFMHRMMTKMVRAQQQGEVPDPKILHERIGYFAEVLAGTREAGTENPPLPKPDPAPAAGFDGGELLKEMYEDDYYPNELVDRIKALILEAAAFLESGERDGEKVQAAFDRMTQGINELESAFEEKESELETNARESIGKAVESVLKFYGVDLETEEAIRERDW